MSSPSQMIQQLQQHSVASHNGLNDSQVTLASSCHPTHTAGSLTSQHQHLTGFSSELLACWLFGAVGFFGWLCMGLSSGGGESTQSSKEGEELRKDLCHVNYSVVELPPYVWPSKPTPGHLLGTGYPLLGCFLRHG